jgi:hypothetical protein
MSATRVRAALRAAHLGAAVIPVMYVYNTPAASAPLTTAARVAVPVIAVCGLLMWKLPRRHKRPIRPDR